MKPPYPTYDVLAKWDSPSFDTVTRGVIQRRLEEIPERRFFTPAEFEVLEAVAARLIPQAGRAELVPIAPWIDADLFMGRGEGFRRPDLPPEPEVWRIGLGAIDAEARHRYVQPFASLHPDSQDATLRAVQKGDVESDAFGITSPARVFIAILSGVVGVYYAHPAAWNEIGFGGPASPRGYVRMGLDERDPWEAPLSPDRRRS